MIAYEYENPYACNLKVLECLRVSPIDRPATPTAPVRSRRLAHLEGGTCGDQMALSVSGGCGGPAGPAGVRSSISKLYRMAPLLSYPASSFASKLA